MIIQGASYGNLLVSGALPRHRGQDQRMRGKNEVGFENKVCAVQCEVIAGGRHVHEEARKRKRKALLDSLQHVTQTPVTSSNHASPFPLTMPLHYHFSSCLAFSIDWDASERSSA